MDLRENAPDLEEAIRTAVAGLLRNVWTAMPVRVTQDTADGHVATVQPTIKRQDIDPETGQVAYVDHPIHPDAPIHHMGGGGVSLTHPTKQGDTGTAFYAARAIDTWFQSDGTQQPIDTRMHSLGDAMFLSGIRSLPRILQQVDKNASQLRSDDKHHVIEQHPTNGTHIKSVDPSTPPASVGFDPFTQATKYLEHLVLGASGIHHGAVDGGNAHTYDLTHDAGHVLAVLNGLHQVLAHPSLGALLSAASGQHLVQAHPENGVAISSSKTVSLSGPSVGIDTPSLSLPPGSISAAALGGSASEAVGVLGGDLSGTLPDPRVVSIANVVSANLLPNAANDSGAAAVGVAIGSLYRNGSNLMVRVA